MLPRQYFNLSVPPSLCVFMAFQTCVANFLKKKYKLLIFLIALFSVVLVAMVVVVAVAALKNEDTKNLFTFEDIFNDSFTPTTVCWVRTEIVTFLSTDVFPMDA